MLGRKRNCGAERLVLLAALLVVTLPVVSPAPAWAIEPYSMKPVELRASADLPRTLKDALDPHGVHVFTYVDGLETPICEIFWMQSVAAQESPSKSSKALYRNLKPGALVGVIYFLAESSEDYREDFHDQKLNPGYYTMRYSVLPNKGQPGDFVLLSPVSVDSDPERVLPQDELSRLSRKASGTDDPAVLSLVPVDQTDETFPDVRMADDGACILQAKLHLKPANGGSAQDVALAIIVATVTEDTGGS